jgi:biotin operon repressor
MVVETENGSTQLERLGLLKALADPTRMRIAGILQSRPHCVEELAERLRLSASTVSFHLRKFDEAGLVGKAKTQYYLVYSLRAERLEARLIDLVAPPNVGAGDTQARQYREKVTRTYFKDGRLRALPKQWRKRRVVLDRFLELFEPGTTYAEVEVNERIHSLFDDHCTIRRMLIDEGAMERQGTDYRRTPPKELAMPTDATRGEIRRAYKELPTEAGIFAVRNLQTGKVLLGSSLNLRGPLNKHRFMLKIKRHANAQLQADWDRLGSEAFVFETLAVVKPTDDPTFDKEAALSALEKEWLGFLSPFDEQGYNDSPRIRE